MQADLPDLPALLFDVPHEVYHADPWGPCLSRSIALKMVARSPLHAWHAHPRLGGAGVCAEVGDRRNGSLLHSLLFGVGGEYEVLEYADYRTKDAQAARDAVLAAGQMPVKRAEYEAACDTASAVAERIRELGVYLVDCRREVTILWRSDGVLCKARLDLVDLDRGLIYDPKFCSDANPANFGRSAVSFGYDIQHAAYTEALEACLPQLAGRIKMEFLLCEPEPPYAVARVVANGTLRGLGRGRWLRALSRWRECLETGKWPAWGSRPVGADAPGWAMSDEMMEGYEEPDWAKGI